MSDNAAEGQTADDQRARELLKRAEAVRQRAAEQQAKRQIQREHEGALVDLARAGDVAAFRKLVEMHQDRLFAVAMGMLHDRDESADVVQDTFVKVHRKLGEFVGSAAFSTWIYRICVNLCIDKKRSQARQRKVDIDDVAEGSLESEAAVGKDPVGPSARGADPRFNLENKELSTRMRQALDELSPEHRAVLLLREVEGMDYEQIAQALDIPRGTVMSRLFHARRNMQQKLRGYLGVADGMGLMGKPIPTKADRLKKGDGKKGNANGADTDGDMDDDNLDQHESAGLD